LPIWVSVRHNSRRGRFFSGYGCCSVGCRTLLFRRCSTHTRKKSDPVYCYALQIPISAMQRKIPPYRIVQQEPAWIITQLALPSSPHLETGQHRLLDGNFANAVGLARLGDWNQERGEVSPFHGCCTLSDVGSSLRFMLVWRSTTNLNKFEPPSYPRHTTQLTEDVTPSLAESRSVLRGSCWTTRCFRLSARDGVTSSVSWVVWRGYDLLESSREATNPYTAHDP
jgi:hypothetical protein